MSESVHPVCASGHDSVSGTHEFRYDSSENSSGIRGAFPGTDDGNEIRMRRKCPSDIEKIGANGRLSEEFRIQGIFDGNDLHGKFLDIFRYFCGMELLFLLQYGLDFLLLEPETLERLMTEPVVKIPVILVVLEDAGEGFLREPEGMEEDERERVVHVRKT